jgi:hypothetical protein
MGFVSSLPRLMRRLVTHSRVGVRGTCARERPGWNKPTRALKESEMNLRHQLSQRGTNGCFSFTRAFDDWGRLWSLLEN